MTRRLVSMLALVALLMQSIVTLWPGAAPGKGVPLDHILMHAQAPEHHHHDDSSLHVEEQGDSVQHSHADEGVFNCIVGACASVAVEVSPSTTFARIQPRDPSPILEGPFRPPRLT